MGKIYQFIQNCIIQHDKITFAKKMAESSVQQTYGEYGILNSVFATPIKPISASIDMNGLALAQIKNKLENMNKKLDTILTREMKTALMKFQKGLSILAEENNEPDEQKIAAKEAIKEFRAMYDNSEVAYNSVSTFKEKVCCKSLSIFAHIMETLYQEEQQTFLTLKTANEIMKRRIAKRIELEVSMVIGDFNNIKIPRLTWNKKEKKEENQNILNSLLKPCTMLPIL